MRLNIKEINHLINLVTMDIKRLLMNDGDKRLLSDSQKLESIKFNKDVIEKLKDILGDIEYE